MSLESCVADLIVEQMQPDYTVLREEIESHHFVSMMLHLGTWHPVTKKENVRPKKGRVLFTTDYFAIVQELEMTVEHTRFKTWKIALGQEWNEKFLEWIDVEHARFSECVAEWEDGMRMYGGL